MMLLCLDPVCACHPDSRHLPSLFSSLPYSRHFLYSALLLAVFISLLRSLPHFSEFSQSLRFPSRFMPLFFSVTASLFSALLYSFLSSLSYSLFSSLFTSPPCSLPYFLHFPTHFTWLLPSLLYCLHFPAIKWPSRCDLHPHPSHFPRFPASLPRKQGVVPFLITSPASPGRSMWRCGDVAMW